MMSFPASGAFTAKEAGQEHKMPVHFPSRLTYVPSSITLGVQQRENAILDSVMATEFTDYGFTLYWRAKEPGVSRVQIIATPHG